MSVPGITFYDFISKLIPGTLLWAPWILISYNSPNVGIDLGSKSLLWYIILFSGFYLTGIIWEFLISKVAFRWLRLCPSMLIRAKRKYFKFADKPLDKISLEPKEIKREYVKAYYQGLKSNVLRDLPVMEAHENFLKTNWLLIGYYAVLAGIFLSGAWQAVVLSLLVIAFGGVPFIWYKTQMWIYYAVWEAEDNINILHKNVNITTSEDQQN